MQFDQVLQKLLSDIAADSLKFEEIKKLVLDMLRGVDFENIALTISADAAKQAVTRGKRLPINRGSASGSASAGSDNNSSNGRSTNKIQVGDDDIAVSDLGAFFQSIRRNLPYPAVLKHFMDEEPGKRHLEQKNDRRDFSVGTIQLSAPQHMQELKFPIQFLSGQGGIGDASSSSTAKSKSAAPLPARRRG